MKNIEVDILIVGGGMAGTVASIAAARRGHRVLILEKDYVLGGTATSGMMCNMFGTHLNGEAFLGGIASEIVNLLIERGFGKLYARTPLSSGPNVVVDRVDYNPEYLKILLEELVTKENVEIIYGSHIEKVDTDGKNIVLIEIGNKYEKIIINAKSIIDSSGNSAIFSMLGSDLIVDNDLQPVTLMYRLCDVDKEKFESVTKDRIQEVIKKGMEEKRLPAKVLGIARIPGGSQVGVNATRSTDINHESLENVSRALIETRKQISEMIPFLKANLAGFENASLAGIGSTMGVRDASRIKGLYELKDLDLVEGKIFEDGVAACCYPVDIHLSEGGKSILKNIGGNGYYNIPYRCMLGNSFENIIAAGRCISSERAAFASLRIIGTVMAIGEAAGVAAALSIENRVSFKELDVKEIQDELKNNGARIN